MAFRDLLWPRRPRNFQLTAVASALIVLAFLAGGLSGGWPWSPKRGAGLACGFLAALLFGFEMAYPLRRPAARAASTAMAWIQAHVYLGGLAFVAVLAHAGFSLPHGLMGWLLLLLSAWTTATGLLGVLLQKWIPYALEKGLRVHALHERIPELVTRLRDEADALMADVSDALDSFYRTQVRDALGRLEPSFAYLVDVRGNRDRGLEPFRRMIQFVDPEEKDKVKDLMAIYVEKSELEAQYSLQRVLRSWAAWTLHAPMAGLLMGLLAIHVLTWVLY